MTTGRIGVVGVSLKVPAVDGEEALFLSRKGFQGEGREGQPDWGGGRLHDPRQQGVRGEGASTGPSAFCARHELEQTPRRL